MSSRYFILYLVKCEKKEKPLSKKLDQTQTSFSFFSSLEPDLLYYETLARKKGFKQIAGISYDGIDALAGPIVVAIATFSKDIILPEIHTIHCLTTAQIRSCYNKILQLPGISYAVEVIEPEKIDELGALKATSLAMKELALSLSKTPDFLLVEGNQTPFNKETSQAILKGEQFSLHIAYSYIIAKATRNAILEGLDANWPEYNFIQNKGLPTKEHLKAVKKLGLCPSHRKSQVQLLKTLMQSCTF